MTYKAHPIIASLWLQTVDDWVQRAPTQQLLFSPFLFKLFLDDIKEIVGLCHDLVQHVQTRFWGSSHIAKPETSARWPGLLVGDVTGAACDRLAAFLEGKGAVAGDRGCRLAAMPHKCQLLEKAPSGVEPGGSQDAGRRPVSWGMMLIKQWRKRKSFRESAPQCPSWMERLCLTSICQTKRKLGTRTLPSCLNVVAASILEGILLVPSTAEVFTAGSGSCGPSETWRRAVSTGAAGPVKERVLSSLLPTLYTQTEAWEGRAQCLRLVLGLNVVLSEGGNACLSFIRWLNLTQL